MQIEESIIDETPQIIENTQNIAHQFAEESIQHAYNQS